MFQLDARRLPNIGSWADCDRLFNARLKELTTRRRNGVWHDTVLPLVQWRDQHLRIERLFGGNAYALEYHSAHIATYFDNGEVRFDASWDSPSTRGFFEAVAPHGWHIEGVRLNSAVGGHSGTVYGYARNGKWYAIESHKYGLDVDAQGNALNAKPFAYTKRTADKRRRKEIRERMQGFEQWATALASCGNSLAAVCLDDETTQIVLHSGGLAVVDNFRRAVNDLYEDPDSELARRSAVTWALINIKGIGFFMLERFERRYDIAYLERVLAYIRLHLWNTQDGWQDERIVVPAGERP